MEENTETVQHLKEERSRREAEISTLNKKVDLMVKDLADKTGNASEAYAKLNEMHQVCPYSYIYYLGVARAWLSKGKAKFGPKGSLTNPLQLPKEDKN